LDSLDSPKTVLFSNTIELAGELCSMDQLGLGTEIRPEVEIKARKKLEDSFLRKKEEFFTSLDSVQQDIHTDAEELIDNIRTGNIDFSTELQSALNGNSTRLAEEVGFMNIRLIELDWLEANLNLTAHQQ